MVKINLMKNKISSYFSPSSLFSLFSDAINNKSDCLALIILPLMIRSYFSSLKDAPGSINRLSFIAALFLCMMLTLYSCKEEPTAPILKTNPVTEITTNSVNISAEITDDGGSPVTGRGVCWGTESSPSINGQHTTNGEGSGYFTVTITGLTPNTEYYARSYAINGVGIAYGNEILFTTSIGAPVVVSLNVSDITANTARSGGKITCDGGADIIAKGICWSIAPSPDLTDSYTNDGTGTGDYQSIMTGLSSGTIYYVRAYASNSESTAYGEEVMFLTKVSDLEGNIYGTVIIGAQVWMTENLRATKLNNNMSIPNVIDNTAWINTTNAAYCWYDNNINYKTTYGALYNWYTVNTGKLCPAGWHVPTDEEFSTLEIYLGLNADSVNIWGWRGTDHGKQMKATAGWDVGGNGTNSSGFSALPGGYRYGATGDFYMMTSITYWWSSSAHDTDRGWYRRLDATANDVYRASTSKKGGKYIRCLKD